MKQISVILIGAGNRGNSYCKFMMQLPGKYKIVGIADADPVRVEVTRKLYDVPEENCYHSWEEILAQPKMADLAVIATMDDMHHGPALKAIELGYDLLLEKPVAQTAQECADIALAAQKKGVKVLVCHVLRYTPFFNRIKELLLDGVIGDVMSVIHVEAVGNTHYSHSYVRGNWHSEAQTTPMLLAKSCHDLDILQWLLDKPCRKVQSFGHLTHFTPANAPEGAPVRCADGGCPVAGTCPYNCRKLYYEGHQCLPFRKQATKNIAKGEVPTDEEVEVALRTTDYGLCVYHANNDVVDHQVVTMEFEGGITVTFSMNSFNRGGRYIRLFGTKGEIYADMRESSIRVYTFADGETRDVPVKKLDDTIVGGHGGGDVGITKELHEYLSGSYTGYRAADIVTSVKNHLIGFCAEKARKNGTIESVDAFMESYGLKNEY